MKLKDLFFKNLGWKIGALILSLALWFHIATEKVYEKQFPAQIEVSNLSPNLQIQTLDPPAAKLSILGSGKQLIQIMLSKGIIIQLDLSHIIAPGEYEYNIAPSELTDIDVAALRNVTFLNGNRIKITVGPKS